MKIQTEKRLINFITLYDLVKGIYIYRKGERNPEYWKKIQRRNFKRFIKYIYRIPFYKQRFESCHVTPDDFRDTEDLKKLPVLTKEEYRQWIKTETNKNPEKYSRYLINATSGSTGNPLKLYETPGGAASDVANLYRAVWVQNKGFHLFRGKIAHVYTRSSEQRTSFVQKLGFFRAYKISIRDGYGKCLEQFNKYKPDFVQGNKTSLHCMFQYAKDNRIPLPPVRCVASLGEKLDTVTRKQINDLFGKKVTFDIYGATETGNFAVERIDDPGKYVIWQDTHAVRVVNASGNEDGSVTGEIAITAFFHKAFPVVNYLLGDTITVREYQNRRYITEIQGRANDYVYGFSGAGYSGAVFMNLMNEVIRSDYVVKQYRIIENKAGFLEWYIVLDADNPENRAGVKSILDRQIERTLKKDFVSEYIWADRLEPEHNGKLRLLICNCKEDN